MAGHCRFVNQPVPHRETGFYRCTDRHRLGFHTRARAYTHTHTHARTHARTHIHIRTERTLSMPTVTWRGCIVFVEVLSFSRHASGGGWSWKLRGWGGGGGINTSLFLTLPLHAFTVISERRSGAHYGPSPSNCYLPELNWTVNCGRCQSHHRHNTIRKPNVLAEEAEPKRT